MWHTWRGDSGYIPGLTLDGHSYSGMRGYSDKGGGRVVIPGLSMDGHGYSGIHGYSDKGGGGGGGEGWTSLDYPWMVTVTLASADTLTRGGGGRVDIPGLSMDGHSYSGIRGYSDKGGGGGRVDIHGLSMDGHSYSQLSTKQLCPSMDGRGLSTAPLDISEIGFILFGWSVIRRRKK